MIFDILITIVIGLFLIASWLTRKPKRRWNESEMKNDGMRKLGALEKVMAHGGEMGSLILSNVIFIRSKKQLKEDIIRKALMALAKRHPLLRMRLVKENGQFMYMKEISNFIADLEVCNTTDWQTVMEDQILKIFDSEKGPLWRVKFLPETVYNDGTQDGYPYQCACVFGFHHVITDGPSYSRLFGEFLTRLHEILNDEDMVIQPLSLLPPVDHYIDEADIYSAKFNFFTNLLGFITAFPSIIKMMITSFSKPALLTKKLGVEKDRNPKAKVKTSIIPIAFTNEQTNKLLAACKKHKVTVHCSIQTAACVAYCSMADGGSIKETHIVSSAPTANLRPYLGAEELNDYHGAYFAGIMLNTEVSPDVPFWDMVTKVNADLKGQIKANNQFTFFGILLNLVKSPDLLKIITKASANLPGQRNRDLVFTNLGNLKHLNRDNSSNVKLSARFGCSAEQFEGAVFANNLATFNGKLFWTFVYYPHVTSKEQAQEYADKTIDVLMKAIAE